MPKARNSMLLTVASRETKNCNLLLIDDERCSKHRQLNDPIGILSKTIWEDRRAAAPHSAPLCAAASSAQCTRCAAHVRAPRAPHLRPEDQSTHVFQA